MTCMYVNVSNILTFCNVYTLNTNKVIIIIIINKNGNSVYCPTLQCPLSSENKENHFGNV